MVLRIIAEKDIESFKNTWEVETGIPIDFVQNRLASADHFAVVDTSARTIMDVVLERNVRVRLASGQVVSRAFFLNVVALLPRTMTGTQAVSLIDFGVKELARKRPDALDITIGGYLQQQAANALRAIYNTQIAELADGRWIIWTTPRALLEHRGIRVE